jgi:hypothetical protein
LIGIQISMLPLDKLKNCLELEKTRQPTHLTSQTISKQIPCFPMMIVHIEDEVNWSLALKTNYHANKPRDRKEATNYKESFIQQSATSTR